MAWGSRLLVRRKRPFLDVRRKSPDLLCLENSLSTASAAAAAAAAAAAPVPPYSLH